MSPMKIGPREQQLRQQREELNKGRKPVAKPGRPRTRPVVTETKKDWRKQLSASKANRNRKDRKK